LEIQAEIWWETFCEAILGNPIKTG